MPTKFKLKDFEAELELKDIKHIYLRFYPTTGKFKISAPLQMSRTAILNFLNSKSDWLKKQSARQIQAQQLILAATSNSRQVYLWGKLYPLTIQYHEAAPEVRIKKDSLQFNIRAGLQPDRYGIILRKFYADQLKTSLPEIIQKWEPVLKVRVQKRYVRQMKTRWGSCNTRRHTIRLNTELARYPRRCLEYVVVHEMVHILEPGHNKRFYQLMDRFLPGWSDTKEILNQHQINSL